MRQLSKDIESKLGNRYSAFGEVQFIKSAHKVKIWVWIILTSLLIILFLPWTQNIRATGTVTTLYQNERPQQINAIIPGRIVKWWIKEGDFVQKGDTIVQLLDVKDEYLDPNLVLRTQEQINAKQDKIAFYKNKVDVTNSQVIAIESFRDLKIASLENKLVQAKRKIIADSAEVVAAEIELSIATKQYERAKQLFADGIITLIEFERRTANYNKSQAVFTEKTQVYQNSRQELIITQLEINQTIQDAADKIFKARGEIATAQSELANTIAEVAKLNNEISNYKIRGSQRWLIAPQEGQITKAMKAGINEVVKEGEMIVEIVPKNVKYAVEMFIKPMDLVLVNKEQKVRFMFDGFPAIVFSGWPRASYGTYGGKIIAVETNRSTNGLFRALVVEDPADRPWPSTLKLGAGAVGFALLKDVPIWYELWRNINGFPPEYYQPGSENVTLKKK